ncbi:MAG: 2,3-diphosphoglycerate-dependent phosphoglycerate mutase [Endomicrobium sp.]|jgi:2,3-bisphosphoglycerate-dependent phosphoglycerate mutase|nr:2,3-diphosphoglycerate-dependent phosphoglycerate mutase [Endomicrobium sp.]
MYKIVLIRHGESVWNKENKFTGWSDVDLSERGNDEALKAGEELKNAGFAFDLAYTSVLKRAIKTLLNILDVMELLWIPVIKSWKLNERHYGALQGLNKSEMAVKYGEDQVKIWRRSYSVSPIALNENDKRYPGKELKYSNLFKNEIPLVESLKNTVERVVPFWEGEIVPQIKANKKIIVVAHGNSLRALIKYLDSIDENAVVNLNIPTARPLVYKLDKNLKPIKNYYLGDSSAVKKAMEKVESQGKIKK